ncbi:hypothetical protein C6P77_07630 [Burkholderia ambifaria]|nr:hypothetical protein C6P77_07630 [Burkholderia ambifaria]
MLRRVVKDHSDIKKSPMMRTEISVWLLKENAIVRIRQAIRVVYPGMSRLCRMSHNLCGHWWRARNAFKSTGLFFHFNYPKPIDTNC